MGMPGWPIRKVASGGIRATEAAPGRGVPYVESPQGVAVTFVSSGGIPLSLGGGATSLPSISAGYYAVRSMRRLVSAYAGPAIRVRSSGGVESDINFLASGELDYTTLNAIAAPTLVTIYDQTGNGWHLTQATVASQPRFSALGDFAGRRPAMFDYFTSTSRVLTTAGMSLSRPDHTHFMVLDPQISSGGDSGASNTHHEFYNGASTNYDSLYTSESRLKGSAGGPLITAGFAPASMPQVMATISRASGRVLRSQDKRATGAALAAATMTHQRIGASTFGLAFRTKYQRLWADVIIASGISDAEANQVQSALESLFSIPTSFTSAIHILGDSIAEGWFSTFLQNSFFGAAWTGTPRFYNYGIGGKLLTAMATNYAAYIAPNYDASLGKNILVIEGASNDIAGGALGATLYTGTTTPLIASAKATGFIVGVCTILPRAGVDTQRLAYNAAVRANAGGADFIIDMGASTAMGDEADLANTTYYNADQIHPNDTGHVTLKPYYVDGVNAALAA